MNHKNNKPIRKVKAVMWSGLVSTVLVTLLVIFAREKLDLNLTENEAGVILAFLGAVVTWAGAAGAGYLTRSSLGDFILPKEDDGQS
jgi:hypothetical protein